MMWTFRRVLALSPHTDDAEFGAGGTIHRLIRAGAEVTSVAFADARQSLPKGFPKDTLANEYRKSCETLGIQSTRALLLDYPVRRFPVVRQEILEELVKLRDRLKPDLVLVHASSDVHQDHSTITQEAIRAFKQTTILGYELPWNTLEFRAQAVLALREEDVQAKLRAIAAYKSQSYRTYSNPTFIQGWAVGRGVTIGERYAEAFEVIRLVIR